MQVFGLVPVPATAVLSEGHDSQLSPSQYLFTLHPVEHTKLLPDPEVVSYVHEQVALLLPAEDVLPVGHAEHDDAEVPVP